MDTIREFKDRINLNVPLKEISDIVSKKYGFGEVISNKTIYMGYGDYSYVLHATTGKYVVKIINKDIKTCMCQSIVDRYYISSKQVGVNAPKVYLTKDGKSLMVVTINRVEYRLFVMQFINGKDIYSLRHTLIQSELCNVAQKMAYIHNIDYKPFFIYDSWAVESFSNQYSKYIREVKDFSIARIIKKIKTLYDEIDKSRLTKCFIHGDIVDMNIVLSGNKLYIVDFSSANYQFRIADIATSLADLCFVIDEIKATQSNINAFVNAYESITRLNNYEKRNILLFTAVAAAVGYMNCINNTGEYNELLTQKYLCVLRQLDMLIK